VSADGSSPGSACRCVGDASRVRVAAVLGRFGV
jgi:hypothetical protein